MRHFAHLEHVPDEVIRRGPRWLTDFARALYYVPDPDGTGTAALGWELRRARTRWVLRDLFNAEDVGSFPGVLPAFRYVAALAAGCGYPTDAARCRRVRATARDCAAVRPPAPCPVHGH